jgi:hypothetical protein
MLEMAKLGEIFIKKVTNITNDRISPKMTGLF